MKHCVAFIVSCVLSTSLASAQIPVTAAQRITATVTSNAPIYLSVPASQTAVPLRTAAPGTLLKVMGEKDDWLQVEFNDPQYGPRLGWIQKKFVKVDDPALRPMDLSVPKEEIKPTAAAAGAKPPASAAATTGSVQGKSRSMGFFVGGGLEGNSAVSEGSPDEIDSGRGFGVTVGYGFTRQIAIYGQISGASIATVDVGNYALGHFDIGLRAHFRAPAKTVVPFVQFGLSSRANILDFLGDRYEATGLGVAFGGGLNAHFTPAVAFTTSLVFSVGNLSNLKINGTTVPIDSSGFTTARVHFGVIWFPQAK